MPQMSPIWWTSIFTMTLMLSMMMMFMNYFIYTPTMKNYKKTMKKKINWKW